MNVQVLRGLQALRSQVAGEKTPAAAKAVAERLIDVLDKGPILRHAETKLARFCQPEATRKVITGLKQLLRCYPNARKVYVSTPITGGQRFYDYLAAHHKHSKAELSPDELKAYQSQVIAVNLEHAHQVVKQEQLHGRIVINPGNIGMPGWQQTDYNRNWTEIVSQIKPDTLKVCDGWQLSYGCLLEMRSALDHQITVRDEHGSLLERPTIMKEVQRAVDQAKKQGFEVGNLTTVMSAPLNTLKMEG